MPNPALASFDSVPTRSAAELAIESHAPGGFEP